jgi:CheY-specific phosphatase CheX/anti-anti-sigma regulatory factor
MRPTVKTRVAVISPQGFLDGINAPNYLTMEDIAAIKKLEIDIFLVSLKGVIFFNKNGLDIFVKLMRMLRENKNINVGFCDYDHKKYEAIVKYYKSDLVFSLFKTQAIAELFAPNKSDIKKTVLLFHDDPSQKSSMAIELFNRGHNPIVAQNSDDFNEKKHNKNAYDVIIDDTILGSSAGNTIAGRVSGNAIVYTLSNFLDADLIESFNISYHTNSLNIGFRLFIFDAFNVVSMNIHGLNFFTKLASSGAEYNANIAIVGMDFSKVTESFKHDLEDAGILFFNAMEDIIGNKELMRELGGSCASTTKNKRAITKPIVSELPRFIDATVSTMEMMTNTTAIKQNVQMCTLEVNDKTNLIASSIGFYGQMDGMIILLFPVKIAKTACELLLGEKTDDMEILLDALAEFANIIAGKVKTKLQDSGYIVDITLPRTYDNIDSLLEVIDGKKGVQVDMLFAGDKFIFFLTR